MKSIINTINYYSSQIALVIIIFLPYEIEVRGLVLLAVWTIYCTIQLIKSRIYENQSFHYKERRKRNKDTLDFALNNKIK